MKIQEVILRAVSKQITWIQAAEIIGVSPRTMRRWRSRYEEPGYDGLFDRRLQQPSPKRVPMETVEQVLLLYREQYFDFNVAHFVEKLHTEHGIPLSYSWVKKAWQESGLVKRKKKRGTHRKRRPRRPLKGMLLHVDGSKHRWLPGRAYHDLIVVFDDATSEVYSAQLVQEESTETVMAALKATVEQEGVFCALYADRASHLVYTPVAGAAPDREHLTQIGRALEQLGIELIPANSPQARGRCERLFGTWQGRLPQELRLQGITDLRAANRYLEEPFIPHHNQHFTVSASEQGSAFVEATGADLDKIFSQQETRVVKNDNTLSYYNRTIQIEAQKFRYSLAKCRVLVCRHLDGRLSLYYGRHWLGSYDPEGRPLERRAQAA